MTDPTEPGPLSLATVTEIVDELERRFEGVLLLTCKHTSRSAEEVRIHYCGGTSLAVGLAHRAIVRLTALGVETEIDP